MNTRIIKIIKSIIDFCNNKLIISKNKDTCVILIMGNN